MQRVFPAVFFPLSAPCVTVRLFSPCLPISVVQLPKLSKVNISAPHGSAADH